MRCVLFILFLLLSSFLQAQNKDYIKGKVIDSNKYPVPFTNVVVKQNDKIISGTTTDLNGNYMIEIPDTLKNFIVSFIYIGWKHKDIVVIRKTKKQ
jgi:hypothetical protein